MKATETKQEILDVILAEMRHAASHGEQLHILFEAHVPGRLKGTAPGADLFIDHGAPGQSWEFSGLIKRQPRPTAAARASAKGWR